MDHHPAPTMRELATESRDLGLIGFRQAHGLSFLVHTGGEKLSWGSGGQQTIKFGNLRSKATLLAKRRVHRVPWRTVDGQLLANVGRGEDNDVVLPYESISKRHAYIFQKEEMSAAMVSDAESTNGTFIRGRPVPNEGQGDPVELGVGDEVRLGSVTFVFLNADQLHVLLEFLQ